MSQVAWHRSPDHAKTGHILGVISSWQEAHLNPPWPNMSVWKWHVRESGWEETGERLTQLISLSKTVNTSLLRGACSLRRGLHTVTNTTSTMDPPPPASHSHRPQPKTPSRHLGGVSHVHKSLRKMMTTCSVPSWLVLLDAARVRQYAKTPSAEMSVLVCTYSVFICHSLFGYQVNMHAGDVMHQWFLLRQLSAQQLALHYTL